MSTPSSTQLEPALQTLRTYEPGSSRADLLPVDDAVRASLDDPDRRLALEARLLAALGEASILGQAYLLTQLALIGSAKAAAPIADRLSHLNLADPACRTLEALPCPDAAAALRNRLPELRGDARIGAVHVLGRKRDESSIMLLSELLSNGDVETAGAAAAALGRIGSAAAGRSLADYFPRAPKPLHGSLVHAVRDCAGRLAQAGQAEEAAALLKAVDGFPVPGAKPAIGDPLNVSGAPIDAPVSGSGGIPGAGGR